MTYAPNVPRPAHRGPIAIHAARDRHATERSGPARSLVRRRGRCLDDDSDPRDIEFKGEERVRLAASLQDLARRLSNRPQRCALESGASPMRFPLARGTCSRRLHAGARRQTGVLGKDAPARDRGDVAAGRRGVLAPRALIVARDGRLVTGHQVLLAVADEIGASHGLQGFAQQRPVFGSW